MDMKCAPNALCYHERRAVYNIHNERAMKPATLIYVCAHLSHDVEHFEIERSFMTETALPPIEQHII